VSIAAVVFTVLLVNVFVLCWRLWALSATVIDTELPFETGGP
jgi:hypothetical protein